MALAVPSHLTQTISWLSLELMDKASFAPPMSYGVGLQGVDMLFQLILSVSITVLAFTAYFMLRRMRKNQ